MPLEAEILAVLKSIDTKLERMAGGNGAAPASDADLDSKYGDPEVKAKDPRDWTGPTMKDRRFSQCPPEYLEMVAERLDYFSSQLKGETEEEQKKLKYQKLDAARARGWAKRLRSGWKPAPAAAGWGDDDRI